MVGAIEAVLAALNAARVRYLIAGGVAVVLHGHLRATADLDLIVQLTPENALDAVRALESLGFRPIAPVPAAMFADAEARRNWVEDKGMTVFGLWSDRAGSRKRWMHSESGRGWRESRPVSAVGPCNLRAAPPPAAPMPRSRSLKIGLLFSPLAATPSRPACAGSVRTERPQHRKSKC